MVSSLFSLSKSYFPKYVPDFGLPYSNFKYIYTSDILHIFISVFLPHIPFYFPFTCWFHLSECIPYCHGIQIIPAWETAYHPQRYNHCRSDSPYPSLGGPVDGGWFISEFPAFTFLFKGLGIEQRVGDCENKWQEPAEMIAWFEQYHISWMICSSPRSIWPSTLFAWLLMRSIPEEDQISIAKSIDATNTSLILSSTAYLQVSATYKYTIDNIWFFLLTFTDNEIMAESIFAQQ